MKVLGKRLENGKKLKCIIECTACIVETRADGYCVRLTTAHPSVSYFIIRAEKDDIMGCYRMLTLEEAERIINDLFVSDSINIELYGNYKICLEEIMQTVYIRNDICEYDDEEIPIYTKSVKD